MALTQTQVSQLYVSIFNRASEGAGNTYWQSGADLATVATQMLATTDAATYFGSSLDTNQAFVEHIYLNTLNKTTADDAAGIAYWVAELDSGVSRGQMVANLVTAATLAENAGAAQDQFNNRVTVSNYMADTVSAAPSDYATSTSFSSGLTVTSDIATVTTAQTAVDTLAASSVAASYTLTTSTDVFETTGADTITATSATLAAGDMVVDNSTTDSDVMTITATAALAAATITNIETINVNLNTFTGTATDVDATNITGAAINLSSSKLGFNGVSGVTAAGANTVVAGSGITTLTVAGLTTGTVDTGSATTATVTGTAALANTINVNGTISLTNNTSTLTTLNATADSVVTYVTPAAIATTVTGAGNVTLKMVDADIVATASVINSNTGTVTLQAIGTTPSTIDATNFAVDNIIVGAAATTSATVASGATLTTNAAMTSLTIATTAATATTATLNAAADITTLVVSDALLTTTINANTANVAIGTLTSVAGNTVNIAGSKNVSVGVTTDGTVDASALTGTFAYTATTATTQTVTGSATAANTITLGAAPLLSYTGGAAVDTINATAMSGAATLGASLGAGNDVVTMNALGAATIALDGGTGTDTLKITGTTGDTTAAATWAVNNFEAIQVQATANSTVEANAIAMNASQLSGKTYAVTSQEAIDGVALTATMDAAANNTADFSGLTMAAGSTIAITATATTGATNQVIKGANSNDTITADTGVHTFTGGAGDDVFIFADADSTSTLMTKITDYQAAAAAGDNDTLTLGATGVQANGTTDVSAVVTGESTTVNAVVTNGVLSLSGLAADVALFDTLAEMLSVADLVMDTAAINAYARTAETYVLAFEFNGNTYVYEGLESATNSGAYAATNVIELTGVTDVAAVSATAAASTILIA